jgi:hypothetical protein
MAGFDGGLVDPIRIRVIGWVMLTLVAGAGAGAGAWGATTQPSYYAHPAVEDRFGVIAPWYRGLNGQCDWRVRISAETMKRYPWTAPGQALAPAPQYIYNGQWHITPDGTITIPQQKDWDNGDHGQRAALALTGWLYYYRYSGDPAAIAQMTMIADVLLDYGQTPSDNPWPNFLISCPTKGKTYGRSDPHGLIQLDIVAQVGLALVRGYECTGNRRWLESARHWAELMAQKRNREPGVPPWNRYANPQDAVFEDMQTGGVVLLLDLFDELIRLNEKGSGNCIVEARDAGRAYLKDVLLPKWTVNDTWARHYWDWSHTAQGVLVTNEAADYLMRHPRLFDNWSNDARNILSLFLNRACVAPASNGETFSGAWAYPEGCACCGRSLDYSPMLMAGAFARFGELAGSEWARELARRQAILFTYDCRESGVVDDNIDGGQVVASTWFKLAHPGPLMTTLDVMGWLPDALGASRENHIMRSSAVVTSVNYEKGAVRYRTFDAPAETVDVLRLSFAPTAITCDGAPLKIREKLDGNGYRVQPLKNGDCIVRIRHGGGTEIAVRGDDPQQIAERDHLSFTGAWQRAKQVDAGGFDLASETGASVEHMFTGNQVRLLGRVDENGGLADVFLDGAKQPAGIDCWNPAPRERQVLYYKNGLSGGEHTLKVVARGKGNPRSAGANLYVQAVQWSAAPGDAGFGAGGGPTGAQRIVFGRTNRSDYVDSQGHAWRPATEFIVRSGADSDSVAASWWTTRRRIAVANTADPELYRYGAHGRELIVNFTAGPGAYHARLKFCETRLWPPVDRAVTIRINGREVVKQMDIPATAGGYHRAVDLVFNGIEPQHGIVEIRFTGTRNDAIIQAIELAPGDGGTGAKAVSVLPATQPSAMVIQSRAE